MGLALDEPKEDDTSLEISGITFVVAPRDERVMSDITVQLDHRTEGSRSGFVLDTRRQWDTGAGCGSCSC